MLAVTPAAQIFKRQGYPYLPCQTGTNQAPAASKGKSRTVRTWATFLMRVTDQIRTGVSSVTDWRSNR